MAQNNSQIIKRMAQGRGIEELIHFTPLRNLPSIVKYGLLPRTLMLEHGIASTWSASHRLDENDAAISVSITMIDSRMFYSKRKSTNTDWVVLALDPSILWALNCKFYPRSAASNEMRRRTSYMCGPYGFAQLFQNEPYRLSNGIPHNWPTYADAEIQVLEPIPPDAIVGARVQRMPDAEFAQKHLNALPNYERDVEIKAF